MLIAIMSALVAALVGVPVVTRMLDPDKAPKDPDHSKQPKSGDQADKKTTVHSADRGQDLQETPLATVNPDSLTAEQDPFSDMDLQELAALTNSPALLQMMGIMGDEPPPPSPSDQAPAPPAQSRGKQPTQRPAQTKTKKTSSSKKGKKKSLVSVNWEGDWSDPPEQIQPPMEDGVERHRNTPSADALFNDTDVPVIRKETRKSRSNGAPPPPKASKAQPVNKPQKVREVGTQNHPAVGVTPPKPPLKLFIDEPPSPLNAESSYEVIHPQALNAAPSLRGGGLQSRTGVDSYGSARETLLDFQPFFALDALRIINEARVWSRSKSQTKSTLTANTGEEIDVSINEQLPEWSLLLGHVNGYLFDLAQEQLRLRRFNGNEPNSSDDATRNVGVSFRQSQWQNVPTEEFIAKSSAPKPKMKPRGTKRFVREG